MSVTALVLLIYALAVARVTGLITQDAITEPVRDKITDWLDDQPGSLGSSLAILISCPWCAGIWVAFIAAPIIWSHGNNPWLLIPAIAMALSQVTGMTSQIGR